MIHLAIGLGVIGFMLARRRRCYLRRLYLGGPMGCYGFGPGFGEELGGDEQEGLHRRGWHGHDDRRGHFRGGPWGHPGRGGRGAMARRFMLRRLFRELDASPAQERAIIAELEQLQARVQAAGELLREGKSELAQAMGAPELDEEALKAVTSRMDTASADLREAGVGALRAVHALLDDGQRRRLAELMDRKPWWRGGGLYR